MAKLNLEQAKAKLLQRLPDRKIHWGTLYRGFWYLCATSEDPDEGQMNPYFKVDVVSGEVSEFYLVADLETFEAVRTQAEAQLSR